MDLHERLAAIVAAMPADGSVTLSVATLRGWIEQDGGGAAGAEPVVIDLTVDDVAEKLRRSPSTVRTWLSQDRLPGSYRLRGREWRIPPATLRAFLQREAEGAGPVPRTRGRKPADLGGWRAFARSTG